MTNAAGGRALDATGLERSAVEAELARVLASAPFERSQQVARFLKYIVEAKLRGDEAAIKAYAVAVDVFGRPQNFDPQADPIVRVQARRLRGMLETFYAAEPSPNGVEIRLPTGRYVPDFVVSTRAATPPTARAAAPADSSPRGANADAASSELVTSPTGASRLAGRWLLALALLPSLVLLVLVAIWGAVQLGWVRLQPAEELTKPVVVVGEFVPVPSWGGAYASVPGLAVELVTDLQLFDDLDARLKSADAEVDGMFQLSGLVRPEGSRALITATLRRSGSDEAGWSHSVVVPLSELPESIDDISQRLAEQLGATDGPLHKSGYEWLALHPESVQSGIPYVCRLLFADFISRAAPDKAQRARTCVLAELQNNPDSAEAIAASAVLKLAAEAQTRPPGDYTIETRAAVNAALSRAQSLAGTSSAVWFAIGSAAEQLGQHAKAVEALRNSLQLNPANLHTQAALARSLVLGGVSGEGVQLASAAIANSRLVPGWYRIALAVDGLRTGQNGMLLRQAQLAAEADSELAAVLAAIGGRRLGQAEVLDRYLAQALESPRIKKYGMLPVLRTQVSDPELLRTIAAEMSLAGVDAAEINGPLS